MDNSWVKLYRKIADHPIIKDAKACQVILWLFTQVDKKTGKVIIGRFLLSRWIRMNPSTLYKVLSRLEKKYKMITQSSNNKFTEISLLNWAKYNDYGKIVTQSSNNKVTTKEQQSNTPIYIQDNKTIDNKTKNYDEEEKNSDEFSQIKAKLGIPENPTKGGVTKEFQFEALRIIKALGIKENRRSSYFKAVKEIDRGKILTAYSYALDYPTPEARDKMFFWRLNHEKTQ